MDLISVRIHTNDPIVRAGVSSELLRFPHICVTDGGSQPVGVNLVVSATLDESTARLLRKLNQAAPPHTALLLDRFDDADLALAAATGVLALLPRTQADPDRLAGVISAVSRGEADIPGDLLSHLLNQVSRMNSQSQRRPAIDVLTERERLFLSLSADGLSNTEIALKVGFSERTVKSVFSVLITRLGLNNRVQAVAWAIREGHI
ncbi:LuxR C-terminal-related transcriptional regulator [Kitasatospora sp. NPDC057904]|uniref:helix-turn-helix transcriptional regulator n=1 Tax=unclassified Kitasatospora TaxID=2633591 RepID=UPI0036DD79BD